MFIIKDFHCYASLCILVWNVLKAEGLQRAVLATCDAVCDKGQCVTAGTAGHSSSVVGCSPFALQWPFLASPSLKEQVGQEEKRCAMLHDGQGLELEV